MHDLPLPDDIETAVLRQGRVLVAAGARARASDLRIEAGGHSLPVLPLTEPPVLRDVPIPLPLMAAESDEAALMVDALPDWRLAGTPTLQVEIRAAQTAQRLTLGAPVDLPAGAGMEFRASLAAHRARATLTLVLTPAGGGDPHSLGVAFDAGHGGGTHPAGYQHVALPLPALAQPHRAVLVASYLGSTGTGTGAPYLFVAGPRIEPAAPDPAAPTPVLRTGPRVEGALWMEAQLPPLRAGDAAGVDLVMGDRRVTLMEVPQVAVTLVADHGHTLMLGADRPCRLRPYLDGVPLAPVELAPEARALRLPAAHLRGEPVRLQLRDLSGTAILYDSWALPPALSTPAEAMQRESRAPFPAGLFAQSAHRFAGLRAHAAAGADAARLADLTTALAALEAGHDRLALHPIALPDPGEAPEVSVIVPAHNKAKVTYACLCGLLLAWNRTSFEVILVDDASTDETATLEGLVASLRVVRHATAQRFIRACNAGAARARGRYIVLLNNDTEPTCGWLDELHAAFDRFDRVGIAGSRLLYPDGRLQDGGGIVWGNGNPWNYGQGANPWEPRFCYARQVDYLSGAALMIPRDLWDQVGGLSSYLEPMYFEDTDLSFKVRAAGRTTWMIPSSIVYHYEGTTSGTDTRTGFKRFQEVNRPRFKQRWARAFAGHGREGVAPDLEKDRGIVGRVLFIDYQLPRPDLDAGSYAAMQEIRLVQSLGWKVTFLPENLAHLGRYATDLERMGVEVVTAPFALSVEAFLRDRGAEFDAVYITRFHVAESTVATIRKVNPSARILLNNADLHFLREMRAALARNDAERLAETARLRARELAAMESVDLVLSYNDVEHALIQSHSLGAVRVMKCPWVVALPDQVPPAEGREGLSFLGSYAHHPNIEAMDWFVREVMARLQTRRPDIVLSIYGSGMTDAVRALASPVVRPVGYVERAEDAYDRHRLFVAPLQSGAGIKGKVLTALAQGVPCLLSPVAAEGIGLRHGHDCLILDRPQDWQDAIAALYDDDAERARLAANARAYVAETFSFARGRALMRAAFEAADLFGSLD